MNFNCGDIFNQHDKYDRKHGLWIHKTATGVKWLEINFVHGILEGTRTQRYSTGDISSTTFFKNNIIEGEYIHFESGCVSNFNFIK
jgi:antitoxin component YwqK of YwqJK toxin-antitoxin module